MSSCWTRKVEERTGLRNEAILLDQVNRHIPLSPVIFRCRQEELDLATVERLIGEIKHVLEVVVGLLERVVEEEVRLRKSMSALSQLGIRGEAAGGVEWVGDGSGEKLT